MKKYINLELPSIVGMGAIGPSISVFTATLFAAISTVGEMPNYVYPLLMFILCGLVAVFPTVNSNHKLPLKLAMWPIASIIIFASAWGSNSGLSAGEEAMSNSEAISKTSGGGLFVSSAYADDVTYYNITSNNLFTVTNDVYPQITNIVEMSRSNINTSVKPHMTNGLEDTRYVTNPIFMKIEKPKKSRFFKKF